MIDRQNSTVSAYLSSLTVSAFSLTVNEIVAIAGLVLAALTFLINWRYKHLHYRLAADRELIREPKEGADVAEE